MHADNSFITLTYDDQHLPQFGSLNKIHFQKFIKRFRKEIHPLKIRYYHCGEYGDGYKRPHYHALIFGYDFPDKQLWSYGQGKDKLYRSTQLERLWDKGHSSIGNVTIKSAAYCARYTLKKVRGLRLKERDPKTDLLPYQTIDYSTGEIIDLQPEYTTMSTHPGIGRDWYEKYKSDVFPDDYVVVNGRKKPTPKYYRNLLEQSDPAISRELREKRVAQALLHAEDQTHERLLVREQVKTAQTRRLERNYESGT